MAYKRPAGVAYDPSTWNTPAPAPASGPDDTGAMTKQAWWSGIKTYGTTDNWGGYSSTQNTGAVQGAYGHDEHANDIQGGLSYTDAAQNTAIDKNGVVYIKFTTDTGDQVWQPYQAGTSYLGTNHIGNHQEITGAGLAGQTDTGLFDSGITTPLGQIGGTDNSVTGTYESRNNSQRGELNTAADIQRQIAGPTPTPPHVNPANNPTTAGGVGSDGSSGVVGPPGKSASTEGNPTVTQAGPGGSNLQPGTNVTDTTAAATNTPQTTANSSATTSTVGGTTVPGVTGVGGAPVVSAAVPTTQAESAVVNPVNHDFIAGLQANIASGQNAVTNNAQAQETQNSNMERMAAGANTLSGNYAAQGAAGQGQEALLGQQQTQQANVAGAAQQHQDEGRLGQALGQESQQSIGADKAAMDSQASQLQDLTQTLQNEIQGKTDQQSQQIKQYIDSITTALNQYQNGAAAGNFDQEKLMEYLKTGLAAAGTVAAIVGSSVLVAGA